MRLSQLLKDGSFCNAFAIILEYAPETERMRSIFMDIFEFLQSLPSIVKIQTFVETNGHFYLGDDIFYVTLYIHPKCHQNLYNFPLLQESIDIIYDLRHFREIEPTISKENILALLLWKLVGIKQFSNSTASEIKNNDKAIECIYEISPYNLSSDKAVFRAQAESSVHEFQGKVLNLRYENLGSILDVPPFGS